MDESVAMEDDKTGIKRKDKIVSEDTKSPAKSKAKAKGMTKQSPNSKAQLRAIIDAVREISDSANLSKNFFVAHCMDSVSSGEKPHLLKAIVPSESTCIAIGPEGDFTSEEVQEMLHSGAKEITLGDMRLRAETAAIVAVTLFAARQV